MSRGAVIGLLIVAAITMVFAYTALLPEDDDPRPVPTATVGQAPAGTPGGGDAGGDAELIAQGQQLAGQLGCTGCHSLDGSVVVGPTWQGLAGSEITLADGTTVTADEEYIRTSITDPDAQIHEGFQPGIMSATVSAQMDQINAGNNLDALVAYIMSIP